jgi:hypothetical protein
MPVAVFFARHFRESGNPATLRFVATSSATARDDQSSGCQKRPAFAGMTSFFKQARHLQIAALR